MTAKSFDHNAIFVLEQRRRTARHFIKVEELQGSGETKADTKRGATHTLTIAPVHHGEIHGKKLCTRGAHATPGAHRRAMSSICHPTSVTPKPVAQLFFAIPSEAQHARLPVQDPW
jgi:hypothetical protein